MHELSVTEALLDLALHHAQAAHALRVTQVHVVIGQLATIVDESVQFYWDLISHDTLADGARLNFRRVPAVFRCERCEHAYQPAGEVLACPRCGSLNVRLVSGDEFYLEALDIIPDENSVEAPPAALPLERREKEPAV